MLGCISVDGDGHASAGQCRLSLNYYLAFDVDEFSRLGEQSVNGDA
jgi:hypothetical protein